jgi:hypothetical protein
MLYATRMAHRALGHANGALPEVRDDDPLALLSRGAVDDVFALTGRDWRFRGSA